MPVAHQNDHIDRKDRIVNGRHHPPIQKMARLVNARRVDENDLAFGKRYDAFYSVTGGLRLIRDGGDLLADEPVQERGFARIRTADESGIAAAKFFTHH